MATSQERKHVVKKDFPHEVILWILRHCDKSTEVKVGFYQLTAYMVWSFKGKKIATGVFPIDRFCASVKITGFGNYKDTEIKGYCTEKYYHLGNKVK